MKSLTKAHKALGNKRFTGVSSGAESLTKKVIANYLAEVKPLRNLRREVMGKVLT
jgi:hypothetical protein